MVAILLAGALAMMLTLGGTVWAIRILGRHGYGQEIREDGPTTHHTKRGTPTMGGTVIILSVVVSYFVTGLVGHRPTVSGLLLLFLFVGLGAVGFLDDYIKIVKQRSLGLRSKAKMTGQVLVAIIFGVLALQFPERVLVPGTNQTVEGATPASRYLSFTRDWEQWTLPTVLVIALMLLLIAGTSNAVNLTDGLDGLAAGSATMVFGAYTIMAIWQSRQSCQVAPGSQCYDVRDPLDLAVLASALAGASFGFLWWNASPARIFMGDTGSLALGGGLAGLAILTRTEFLLVILGGLFVVQALSVMLQVGYFKLSGGKRIFRMAPLHHHFELKGWAEITVVIRFWIIAGVCVAAGLGIFYAEWVAGT